MRINLSLTIEFNPDEWVLDNRDPREEVRCMVRDLIADNIDNSVAVTLDSRNNMDGRIYYQPILIDTEAGTHQALHVGIKYKTAWDAEDKLPHIAAQLGEQEAHLHLGVQEVRSTPMPGHKPVSDYKQGGHQ